MQDDEISNEECLKVGEIITETKGSLIKAEEGKTCETLEQKSKCFLPGEEMVVLPPLLHPHLRDGGLRGARPPVLVHLLPPAR